MNTGSANSASQKRKIPLWLAAAAYCGYFLAKVALVALTSLLFLLFLPFPRFRRTLGRRLLQGFLVFFTKTYLPGLGICRVVEISGLDMASMPKGIVCVANHRSAMDALLLLPMLYPSALVLKPENARKPAYAGMGWLFDFVSINPGSFASLHRSVEKCRRLLASDVNLLVFPEGKCASSLRLMPFSDFAFRIAFERGVPVLPVVIHSGQPFLSKQKGSYFPRETVDYRVRFLQPALPAEHGNATDLSAAVRRHIAKALANLDREFLDPHFAQPDPAQNGG